MIYSDEDANDAIDGITASTLEARIDSVTINDVADAELNASSLCEKLTTTINSIASHVYATCSDGTPSANSAGAGEYKQLTITGYFTRAAIKTSGSPLGLKSDVSGDNTLSNEDDWDSASLGGVSLDNIETLTDDLRYTPIYSPDFATSESTLPYIRENGYKIKSLLTAVDDGAGAISWKYLDLTTSSDSWFSSMYDFNLFTTEMERGYFALLEQNAAASMALSTNLNIEFYQHYNSDSTATGTYDEAGHVDNFFKGTLYASVSGDEGDNSQVVATIQNRDYPMLNSGNSYTLELSRENFPNIAMSDSNITLKAYDEVGNIATTSVELNLSAPAKPVIQLFNGKLAFVGTTSSDLHSFNIYTGRIDDRYATHPNSGYKNLNPTNDHKTVSNETDEYGNSANDLTETLTIDTIDYTDGSAGLSISNYKDTTVGKVTKTNSPTYYFMTHKICADASNFDTKNSGWRVVAVDGDGDLSNSRASDIKFMSDWYPIYKNASILSVNNSKATDNLPATYDSDCDKHGEALEQDNGVVLTTTNTYTIVNTNDYNVTIAYDTISTTPTTTVGPANLYSRELCIGATEVAADESIGKVQFAKNIYVSTLNTSLSSAKTLLIHYKNTQDGDNTIYSTTFDNLYETGAEDTDCYRLDNAPTVTESDMITMGQTIIKGE